MAGNTGGDEDAADEEDAEGDEDAEARAAERSRRRDPEA
jgi:hypothetical protein